MCTAHTCVNEGTQHQRKVTRGTVAKRKCEADIQAVHAAWLVPRVHTHTVYAGESSGKRTVYIDSWGFWKQLE